MANFFVEMNNGPRCFIITKVAPGNALVVLNDDQCTGSRVSETLTATDRRGRRVRLENQTDKPVFVLVDGERGFARNGEPVFSHIRDAVPGKEGRTPVVYAWPKPFPRLRYACRRADRGTICVPGGEPPLHFWDEVVVPDFSTSGTCWFLVPRNEIDALLAR